MNINDVKKIVAPLQRRVMLMVGKVIINAVSAAMKAQASILSDEVRDKMDFMQHYGFSSRPLSEAEGVAIFLSGNRDHGIVIASGDKRYEIPLEVGEVSLYTDEGDKIHMKRGRIIDIVSETINITGDINLTGDLTASGEVQAKGKNLSTHTHGPGTYSNGGGPVAGTSGGPL